MIVYVKKKMMKNLWLNEGEIIQVQYVNLDIARFAKFQPQSVDFLEITNPKAVYVLKHQILNFFFIKFITFYDGS